MATSKTISDSAVLDIIRPMMDVASSHEEVLSRQRTEYTAWYRSSPYGNERPNWSQTVHPTIFSVVEWMKPGLMEVFAGDFFDLLPVITNEQGKAQAQETSKKIKAYIRHKLFNELEGEQQIEDFIHDAMVYHYGVMKVTQREDYDVVTEDWSGTWQQAAELMDQDPTVRNIEPVQEDLVADPMSGQLAPGISKGRLTRRVVKYEGFYVESVPPAELRKTPGYKSLDECPLVAHVVRRTLDYIRRQERAGVYRKGSAQKVEDYVNSTQEDRLVVQERRENLALDGMTDVQEGNYSTSSDDSRDYAMANTRVEVWECYTKLDLDGSGLLKPAIVTICGDIVLRSPIENPYGGPPFEVGSIYREPHRIEGRPVPEVLNHRQRVLSNLLRNIQDSAALSTYRNWLTTDARTKKMMGELGPGDVALVPQLNVLQEIAPAPSDPMMMNAFSLTLQEVSKESGVNENMQGLDNNSLNHTAAGMSMRLTAGMQRQKLYAKRLARTFKRILGRILDIIRLYPPQDDLRVVGTDIFLSPDDIGGRYTVAIDVGIGPQDKQAKASALEGLIQFQVQAGAPLGVTPGMIMAAQKAKFAALEIDISAYLPEPSQMDAIQQMQEQMQQMGQQLQQAQGHAQGLQQALDESKSALDQANIEGRRLDLEQQKIASDHEIKMTQIAANQAIKRDEITANLNFKAMVEAAKLDASRELGATPGHYPRSGKPEPVEVPARGA